MFGRKKSSLPPWDDPNEQPGSDLYHGPSLELFKPRVGMWDLIWGFGLIAAIAVFVNMHDYWLANFYLALLALNVFTIWEKWWTRLHELKRWYEIERKSTRNWNSIANLVLEEGVEIGIVSVNEALPWVAIHRHDYDQDMHVCKYYGCTANDPNGQGQDIGNSSLLERVRRRISR